MHLDDDAVRRIEDSIISAAIQPERWTDAVSLLVAATGARGAGALPLRGRVPGIPMSDSLEAVADGYFRGGWSERDYRTNGLPQLIRTGLFVDQDYATPDIMRTEPFYASYLRPHGFQWSAGLLVEVGGDAWVMMLQRTGDQGPYTPEEQQALKRMIAPLNRAAQLAHSMGEARLNGLADAFGAIRNPSLLLDRTGRVLRVSAAAERLLGRDLNIRAGELVVPADARATAAIRRHIAAAVWTDLKPDSPALAPVIVEREGCRPLILRAQPLRKTGLEYFDGCRAILTIVDLDARSPADPGLLKQLYGLTPKESELCNALLAGHGPQDCTDLLQMSMATVRSHLKRIFAKTGTSGQSELLLLLSQQARL
ncbi:hypothetical protein ASF49_05125 [Methylobacterium sp. Leaf104]|uniref:helix-turn-helix transcriptional regulator n=1 Tax=Methylobacterium TaxID=407 RepID=UPI0006FB6B1B|nr:MULTISPECIES: helix-turn-helix transcriptional regulator [Methylobacterium]KQP38384.1 hypothetical protein ASF49_05125 [Methylobacterium sp. Leaf104]MCI9880210.1 helix-turn-helix transcriptional regulator [Methylobacterium goesingense]